MLKIFRFLFIEPYILLFRLLTSPFSLFKNWIERSNANALKWEMDELEKLEKEKKERMKILVPKYGEAIALKILNNELWVGMDFNHVYEVKGKYELKVDNVINKVEQTILYFEKHKNRLGNDAYDFEITFESGKAVGWKNRANVATRNL
jgi:hypothetical protein